MGCGYLTDKSVGGAFQRETERERAMLQQEGYIADVFLETPIQKHFSSECQLQSRRSATIWSFIAVWVRQQLQALCSTIKAFQTHSTSIIYTVLDLITKMSEHEDLSETSGHGNISENYPFNPASVIVSVVFSLIFLLGTVGNSLVLAVLLRNGQMGHNTTNLFILNLSVADFFFIVFCVPFQATIYSLEGWVFGSFMCKAVHFFINLTMYASSFTLAAVSVDRYLAIRYPLRSRELRTPCNAVAAMAVIWGLSFIFAGPYLSYYDITDIDTVNVCIPGWEEWRRKVLDTCTFICGYVIPVLIVSLSYTRTIKYLWTAVDPLDGMSESKKAKRKVTKMIIIVTVLFCLCWLPYHVVILCYLYGDFPFNQTTYAFRLLSHCMAYANSCLNPIVYALVSKHFRKGFKKVFSCILIKKARNKVHVVHVANTVPGFEAGSTEVSHINEENRRQNACEMGCRTPVVPEDNTAAITLPYQQQP